jgi:DNA-binding CsgD family transcriptional regulator
MSEVAEPITLTSKQRDVLDLLLDHMTSKEIAIQLDISPHTVDQRIGIARRKLGASSRSQLVLKYRALQEAEPRPSVTPETTPTALEPIYEETVYQNSDIADPAPDLLKQSTGGTEMSYSLPSEAGAQSRFNNGIDRDLRVVPEIFDGAYGTYARICVILAIATLILFVMLGGLTMFSQLSSIMAQI